MGAEHSNLQKSDKPLTNSIGEHIAPNLQTSDSRFNCCQVEPNPNYSVTTQGLQGIAWEDAFSLSLTSIPHFTALLRLCWTVWPPPAFLLSPPFSWVGFSTFSHGLCFFPSCHDHLLLNRPHLKQDNHSTRPTQEHGVYSFYCCDCQHCKFPNVCHSSPKVFFCRSFYYIYG